MLTAQGFPLAHAMHAVNALSVFVIGHATAEAQMTVEQNEQNGAGDAAWLSGLEPARYPLIVEAASTGAGVDDAERLAFALDALLNGFAATLQEPA